MYHFDFLIVLNIYIFAIVLDVVNKQGPFLKTYVPIVDQSIFAAHDLSIINFSKSDRTFLANIIRVFIVQSDDLLLDHSLLFHGFYDGSVVVGRR